MKKIYKERQRQDQVVYFELFIKGARKQIRWADINKHNRQIEITKQIEPDEEGVRKLCERAELEVFHVPTSQGLQPSQRVSSPKNSYVRLNAGIGLFAHLQALPSTQFVTSALPSNAITQPYVQHPRCIIAYRYSTTQIGRYCRQSDRIYIPSIAR